ncbi:vitellogenin [Rhodotorula toruloides]|uniref:Vitellogenin n=1 Tax=Rhodotorula toruloides TaxID=5286 RepID=A0A511KAZ9_RHOTO|nr:vitellogenin [Rhodotorula toruloides]
MEHEEEGDAESRGVPDGSSERTTPTAPPTIFLHLLLSVLLLALPTALSGELASIRRYRHYGFFAEMGFWLQESVTSLCDLAKLAAFWHLIATCDTLIAFVVVGIKDFLLPRIFHLLLNNPLDSLAPGEATLSIRQQLFVFALVAAWVVMSRTGTAEADGGRGRRRE